MNRRRILTERLILRPWMTDDAEALFRYASDRRVSEPASWPCHTSVEMSREVIELYFMPNEDLFAITDRTTGEPIGCIGLVPQGDEHYPPSPTEREVGYWLGYPRWGEGLTTEALHAFIGYCKESLRLESLLITANADNHASRRVAEKCGFCLIASFDHCGRPSVAMRLKI